MGDCCGKHTERDDAEYKDLIVRLNRIEGQIRGVRKMVEDSRYCIDILHQVTAVQAALNAFNKQLLTSHIKNCVMNDARQGQTELLDELCETIQRLMK